MNMKKLILGIVLALAAQCTFAQSAIVRGESSAGVYENIKSTGQALTVAFATTAVDPCASPSTAKLSAVINISTATTTALVAPVASQVVYVCSFSMTISQVVTTANTIKFVRGTGATCGTGTADLTGAFGTGGVTAAAPIVVASGAGAMQFKGNASDGVCATTTIGGSAAFTGVLTYVQQ